MQINEPQGFFLLLYIQVEGGGGRLPNKGRYRCAASAKPRPGKIFQKKT